MSLFFVYKYLGGMHTLAKQTIKDKTNRKKEKDMQNILPLALELDFLIQDVKEEQNRFKREIEKRREEYNDKMAQLKDVGLLDKLMNEIDRVEFRETKLYSTITEKLDIPDIKQLKAETKDLEVFLKKVDHVTEFGKLLTSGDEIDKFELRRLCYRYQDSFADIHKVEYMKAIVDNDYDLIDFSMTKVYDGRTHGTYKGVKASSNRLAVNNTIQLFMHELYGYSRVPIKFMLKFAQEQYYGLRDFSFSIPSTHKVTELENELLDKVVFDLKIDELTKHLLSQSDYYKYSRDDEEGKMQAHVKAYIHSLNNLKNLDEDQRVDLIRRIAEDFRKMRHNLDVYKGS